MDTISHIQVTGMGGGINFEMQLIEKALRDAGFEVEVDNSAADWTVSNDPTWHQRMLDITAKKKTKIRLTARHIPWGG